MEVSRIERNRILARFKNGKLLKGYTHDFKPMTETFHIVDQQGGIHEIKCLDLKAVFFVRTFEGRREYIEKKEFSEVDCTALRGLKIKLEFSDGEVIRGFSLGFGKERKGFYVTPIDPQSNNERIYVITDALRDVKTGSAAEQ